MREQHIQKWFRKKRATTRRKYKVKNNILGGRLQTARQHVDMEVLYLHGNEEKHIERMRCLDGNNDIKLTIQPSQSTCCA